MRPNQRKIGPPTAVEATADVLEKNAIFNKSGKAKKWKTSSHICIWPKLHQR